MPAIILPGRFRQQPQYLAPLDPSHWAYKNIIFAYSAGRGLNDGKHPNNFGSLVGTVVSGTSTAGRNIQIGAAASYAQFPNITDYNPLGGVTAIALIRPGVSVTQNTIVSHDTGGGGTATPVGFMIENGAVSLNRANTGFRVWNSVATVTAGQLCIVAVTQGSNIGTAPKFWINGVFDIGAPVNRFSGSGTGAPTAATTTLKMGLNSNSANQFAGEIYDVLIIDRECSHPEIVNLTRAIWGMWKATPRRIWYPAAAGGTAYFQDVAGSITAAGALTKRTNKSLVGSSTYSGSIVKLTNKYYSGSLTAAGAVAKQTTKSFAGSITGSGALSTMILFTAELAGSITASGAISKMTSKALAGASTLAGAITKKTFRTLDGNITVAGIVTKLTKKAFSGAVTVAGAVTTSYQVLKSLAGSITPSGALAAVYIAFVAGVLKLMALMGIGQ